MKKKKNAAALILAAVMTILPAYSLTAGNRIGRPLISTPATKEDISEETPETPSGGNDTNDSSGTDADPAPDTPPGPDEPDDNTPDEPSTGEDTNNGGTKDESKDDESQEETERLYIVCSGNGVNLRTGAGSGYKAAGTAQKDESYAVLAKLNGWYCIYYRGKQLYISAAYAKEFRLKKSENAAIEAVLEAGYALIGTPYVFGAVRLHDGKGNFYKNFTTNAFDCSSLTQYAFYKGAKKLLGTTTRIQVKEGKAVKRSELQRGDCIYFTNASRYYNTGVERVGHVAIYLGDDYILHTSSDYARIEKLTAARKKYYIEARRFV